MYITTSNTTCQCNDFDAAEYLATALTALRMPRRVWFAIHIRCPTSDRKASSTSGSFLSNRRSFRSTVIEILLPRVTPDFVTMPSAKTCCDIVNVPALQVRENRQAAYHRDSPRLLIGRNWFRSSQNLSHLLKPHRKNIVYVYYYHDGINPLLYHTHHARISLTLLKPKTPHTTQQEVGAIVGTPDSSHTDCRTT